MPRSTATNTFWNPHEWINGVGGTWIRPCEQTLSQTGDWESQHWTKDPNCMHKKMYMITPYTQGLAAESRVWFCSTAVPGPQTEPWRWEHLHYTFHVSFWQAEAVRCHTQASVPLLTLLWWGDSQEYLACLLLPLTSLCWEKCWESVGTQPPGFWEGLPLPSRAHACVLFPGSGCRFFSLSPQSHILQLT